VGISEDVLDLLLPGQADPQRGPQLEARDRFRAQLQQAAIQVVAGGEGLWPHLGPVTSRRP
jgi:hypothetical protein